MMRLNIFLNMDFNNFSLSQWSTYISLFNLSIDTTNLYKSIKYKCKLKADNDWDVKLGSAVDFRILNKVVKCFNDFLLRLRVRKHMDVILSFEFFCHLLIFVK
jgi:hypothetical protein